ncbi:hypothetical protein GM418_07160 [Maribellus comscasis]|uniref:Uncharacterized protein n=1 Tax=Maribellus comscasis TaxID=2681766 RepID=A0A6I6JKS2_9BACT|nr:carcinine hydrolase/isopenicillin-N N-acyltransferase family protein [Maribellus comscasis]QGY43445.1 hypothetical protein GM418_07160 [Maribellus comscasis]
MRKTLILFCIILLSGFLHISFGCTIFTASSNSTVLAGNNEDMCTTNTVIHIIPPSDTKFGRIFWGFKGDGNYQGGMNEHGLFFDGASTPAVEMSGWNLPEYQGRYIFETVLEKCKTVEEAIEFVQKYSQPYLKFSHILVADAKGGAVVFEWGNNRMNYIRKGDDNFLIATNFNLTETFHPEKECNRYATAKKMLSENEPSVSLFEEILSLTHAEGKFPTVYSNLCDLKKRKMYLYNFHNFSFRKAFDLQNEFEKGEKKYLVRSFFPQTNAELIFRYMSDCVDNFEDLPSHSITFKVNAKKPFENSKLYLQGNARELGDWDEPGVEMEKQTGSVFQKTISLKEGKLFAYTFATEKGECVLLGLNNQKIGEEVMEVKSDTTIVVDVLDWKRIK